MDPVRASHNPICSRTPVAANEPRLFIGTTFHELGTGLLRQTNTVRLLLAINCLYLIYFPIKALLKLLTLLTCFFNNQNYKTC